MPSSAQQQLKQRAISFEAAYEYLVDTTGSLNQDLLDVDLIATFFRKVRDRQPLPPVIPLLFWRNCYYLGSPVDVPPELIQPLSDRLGAEVQIISISRKSYLDWFRLRNRHPKSMDASSMLDPLTGEVLQEELFETTQLYLSQVDNQIERIQTIITDALRNRASDIHLEPTATGLRIRYRIDGLLRQAACLPVEFNQTVISAVKVMCGMDPAQRRIPQDGRMSQKYAVAQQQNRGLDIRVNTLPCEGGESAVLRLLPQKTSFSQIEEIGFSPETCAIYKGWLEQPQGIIIFTGPTGSGKTSTLYASLQSLAQESAKIITIENPVEYVLPAITQTQVNAKAEMTFAKGLEAILRQDPDIIMVGEIRNSETAEIAIQAAMTGHLVLTTLHTNDAIGVIPRLRDLGVDPGLMSDALLGVVAQRLVRRVCPHCGAPHKPMEAELEALGMQREATEVHRWRSGRGCASCFQTGYLGREAVIELLDVDETVRHLIHEGTLPQVYRHLHANNFYSFQRAAISKVMEGITTVAEVRRVLPRSALQRKGAISKPEESMRLLSAVFG